MLLDLNGFETTNQQVLSTLTLCKVHFCQSDVVFAESAFENPRKSNWLNRPQSFVPRSIGQDGRFKIKSASIQYSYYDGKWWHVCNFFSDQTAKWGNFKWRVESESKSIEERALAKAAKPLLLVLDDLNRAKLAGAAKGLADVVSS